MTGRLPSLLRVAALGLAFAFVLPVAGLVKAQSPNAGVKSLRDAPLTESGAVPDVARQSTPTAGFGREYRQQPPLIPHKVDGYEVNVDNNRCLACHDWPANTRYGAPKVSETHYVDRQGARLDKVSGARYFCMQCHVVQDDARPLVGNSFQNATQVK